jgi:hypothetical protein
MYAPIRGLVKGSHNSRAGGGEVAVIKVSPIKPTLPARDFLWQASGRCSSAHTSSHFPSHDLPAKYRQAWQASIDVFGLKLS